MSKPSQTIDLYFMDARSKLIDIAAFLDRHEREGNEGDYRLDAFKRALKCVCDSDTPRAQKVLEIFSDPTTVPIPKATIQGANGAWDPEE